MNQAVHKLTNTVLEHACNSDWPLGVSPCFEADSCSGSQEFSLCVMHPECSTPCSKTPSCRGWVGPSKRNCRIVFIGLTMTTRFGRAWPSSGHNLVYN